MCEIMHWTLPQLRALTRNEYDVLVAWLTDRQDERERASHG